MIIEQSDIKTWFYILINRKTKRFFFGQTKFTRKEERHTDSVYTKLLGDWNFDGYDTYWIGIRQEGIKLDAKIHERLKGTFGCKWNKSKVGSNEIFILENYSTQRIVQLIEKYVKQEFDAVLERTCITLRPHQEKFLKKIFSNWEKWREFLLFAKCRAGKSIMVLSTITKANVKRTLVVSRFNSPQQSWEQDPTKFIEFKNIRFINLKDKNWEDQYNDYQNYNVVFWSTVQGLSASDTRKLSKIEKLTSIDFLVFDECHNGDTGQFDKIRKKFANARCLKVSGTAYDQIWDYPEDNRFYYSYEEEQKLYFGQYPKMNFYCVDIDVPGYREIFGDDPDLFTNIFLTNEDKTNFVYPELVASFWDRYFTVRNQRHLKNSERVIVNRNHIIASLPSVAACRLSIPFIKEYAPLDITSDANQNSTTINNHVTNNAKTICLTVEANVLGMTCEKWDCVVHLWKGEDRKRYTQITFRGGSGKHDWDVIDFAPKRGLKVLNETLILSKTENSELLNSEIIDFTNVFEWDDGFSKLSQDKIYDILSANVKDDIQRAFDNLGRNVSEERLNNFDLSGVNHPSGKVPQGSIAINNNLTNEKSALKKEYSDKDSSKKNFDEEKKNKKKLSQVLKSIPLVLAYSIKEQTLIETTDDLFSSKYYSAITQDTNDLIFNLIKSKDISERDVSSIINQYNPIIKKNIFSNYTKTIDSFRISKSDQQVIPYNLLKIIFKTCYKYLLIVGDPCGTCCSYAIEHLGVLPSNIFVWEDHPTHQFMIKSYSSEINIINNIEDFNMKKEDTYCIGNPPYSDRNEKKFSNKKEWKKHLFAAIKKAKTTSFVVPASAISPSSHFEEIREYLSYINTDVQKYFPGVGSTFCVITVEDTVQKTCVIETPHEKIEVELKNIPFLPKEITKENIEFVKETLTGGREWKVSCDYHSSYKKQWEDPNGEIEVLHTTTKSFFTNKDVPLNHQIRVAVSKSGNPVFKVIHNLGLSESMIYTSGFGDIKEAQAYCDFCNSEKIQKAIMLTKFSGWNTKELLKYIP